MLSRRIKPELRPELSQDPNANAYDLTDFEDAAVSAADEDEAPERAQTFCSGRRVPFEQVVVGIIIRLASGDMIPADCRVLNAGSLCPTRPRSQNQESVEKTAGVVRSRRRADGTRYPLAL